MPLSDSRNQKRRKKATAATVTPRLKKSLSILPASLTKVICHQTWSGGSHPCKKTGEEFPPFLILFSSKRQSFIISQTNSNLSTATILADTRQTSPHSQDGRISVTQRQKKLYDKRLFSPSGHGTIFCNGDFIFGLINECLIPWLLYRLFTYEQTGFHEASSEEWEGAEGSSFPLHWRRERHTWPPQNRDDKGKYGERAP